MTTYSEHQGCIYRYDRFDRDTFEKREEEMEEQRLEQMLYNKKRSEEIMLQFASAPFLERKKLDYHWWRNEKGITHIALSMCAFLFRFEHYPGDIVLTMRKPKSKMPFTHPLRKSSPGKGKKYYRSSCNKECGHCNGSLPGCGGCKDPDCAKCKLSKAKAAAKATAQADKDAEAKAED